MPRTYREIKREESGSTGSNEGNSIQSQDFRKMNEKLSKEVHDLRALLQSTSKLHNSKLDSLQAQFTDVLRRTSRENQELRQVLQVQLDTIIQMVSGGPWMFNQAPPEFTQPPVPQNFPHEYAVNQGAPPPTQIPGFDDIGIPQLSQNFARFEGEISDVSQKQQGSFECLKVPGTGTRLPVTTAHVEKTDIENCLFCNDQKHKSQNCTVIKDAGQRMGFVRENQICEKCLKPLDRHEPCIMEICTICKKKKKHNPVLCSTIENRHCSFCLSRDHYYQECPKYSIGVSVTDRRAMLEEEDRCLTCFKGNRVGYHDSCRTRYLCSTCMKKFNDPKIAVHQKSLCLESKSSMPRKEKESSRYAPY